MAVYTQVDNRTLSRFLDGYDVGTATSFKGIAEGVENSNYLLETNKARFILTLYEKRAKPEDLPYFLNLMEHIADKGLPAALPIHDRNDKALQTLMGKPACLISFLSGVSVEYITDTHCAAVGEKLAQMHLATADFQDIRPNDLSLDGWKTLAKNTATGADTVKDGLNSLISDELAFLSDSWPEDLPTGTIHADLFPDNVLFMDDRISGLIDFYFACHDTLLYDLAICINAWCFDENHTFIPVRAKRMVEMYDTIRPISQRELDALPILCRGAALRFLLTRLYDWLNRVEGAVVRVKDPLEYLHRLTFHQSVTNASDYVV